MSWSVAQSLMHPADRRTARPEDDPELAERAKRAAQVAKDAHAQDEGQRTDTVTTHTAEVSLAEVFTGGRLRDAKTGDVKVDAEGRALDWNPHERVPTSLTPEATSALFGVAPAPKPNAEPTPEQAFAAAADSASAKASIRARFEEIAARKSKTEENAA